MTTTPERAATLTSLVAAEIRAWMGRLDVRQSELARRMGENDQWMSMRLKGRTPIDLNELQRIATALGLSVLDLMPPPEVAAAARAVTNERLPHVGRTATLRSAKRRGDGTIGHNHSPIGYGRRDSTRPESPIAANRRRPTQIG